jgi:AcrR family transcriptional regulator
VGQLVRDARQEAILERARDIIAERGVDAVSMSALAAGTGLSRPAIYQYFASKDHVLAELVINEMADLGNALDEHMGSLESPVERIRVWVHYTLAHLASSDHRVIRQISVATLPEASRGMVSAMHGHFMMALVSPVSELGAKNVTATCHLIFASVAAAATRIDEGSQFVREAAALEDFVISGLGASLRDYRLIREPN